MKQLGPSNIRCLVSMKPDVVTITIEWRGIHNVQCEEIVLNKLCRDKRFSE